MKFFIVGAFEKDVNDCARKSFKSFRKLETFQEFELQTIFLEINSAFSESYFEAKTNLLSD